jgi:threonyl-tRNA synthetase
MDENDHRRIGSDLSLYHIQDNAPGVVFWHPRGYEIYRVLEDYIRKRMRQGGYREVRTPQLMPKALWEKSGHWAKFGANMFSFSDEDGRAFALKPMSCPCHLQIFNQGVRSWRELPVRYAEFGACHRNEPSGSLHGLMRTRAFEQDDAHVICREGDVQAEVARFIKLLDGVYRDLGFAAYKIALSTRPVLRVGSDELWDWAEAQLSDAASANGISDLVVQPGEGAFYGPKLEFILKDRQGREWQCGTVQLDMVLPGNLDARYIGEDGLEKVPVMIHHAVFGSMGRFIAILLEHYEGKMPFWLAPDQVAIIPVSEKQVEYANAFQESLLSVGVRAVVLGQNETMQKRLVEAMKAKVSVIAVIGARECLANTVTLRERDGSQVTVDLSFAISDLGTRARA